MDEIDYYNSMEEIAIGQEIRNIMCRVVGVEDGASDEDISHRLYKDTDCGAWFKFTETGVRIGSVVEGSDVEFSEDFDYPFTEEDIRTHLDILELDVEEAWSEANEG